MIKTVFERYRTYGFITFLRYFIAEFLRVLYWGMIRNSYSQKREDLIIDKLLDYKKNGFYVDVGACDPHRFSNTKRFYKKGWSGINIEPNKISYSKFKCHRPRDTNLNMGIASKAGNLTFYEIDPVAISTFSEAKAKEYQNKGFKIVSTENVEVKRLESVLDDYAKNKEVDFISIDTGGFNIFNMEVLKSNNWEKYRPTLVCIELGTDKRQQSKEDVEEKKKYELLFKSLHYKTFMITG